MRKSLGLACVLFILNSLEAAEISLMGGGGSWFGDDTKTSMSFGGGLIVKPGIDFMELIVSYDRSPVKLNTGDRYAARLKGDSLNHFRLGATFPMELSAFDRTGFIFPELSYVLVTQDSKLGHGIGIGGGLQLPLYEELVSVRFEAIDQIYKIPFKAGGKSAVQQDFFLNIRLVIHLWGQGSKVPG